MMRISMSVPTRQGFDKMQNQFDNGFDRYLRRRPQRHEDFSTPFDGIGLGQIDEKFLDPDQWPITSVGGLRQYRMFVQIMINRIRAGESNSKEAQGLVDILEAKESWDNLDQIEQLLPELQNGPPHPIDMVLAELICSVRKAYSAKIMERVELEAAEWRAAKQDFETEVEDTSSSESGQDSTFFEATEVRDKMAKLSFGHAGEQNANLEMQKVLTSPVALGYSTQAIAEAIEEQGKTGRPEPEDALGLPVIPSAEPPNARHSRSAQQNLTLVQKDTKADHHGLLDASQIVPIIEMSPKSEAIALERFPPLGHSEPKTAHRDRQKCPSDPSLSDQVLSFDCMSSAAGKKPSTSPELSHRASFWKFERTHWQDYDRFISPVESEGTLTRTYQPQYTSVAESEVEELAARTGNGPIVVKGFNRPSPAESDAMLKATSDAAAELSKAYEVTETSNERKGPQNFKVPDREEDTRSGEGMSITTARSSTPMSRMTRVGKRRLKMKKRGKSMVAKSKDSHSKEITVTDENAQIECNYRKAKNNTPAEEQIVYLGQRLHDSDISSSKKTQRDKASLVAPKLNLQELTRLPGPAVEPAAVYPAPAEE